MTTGSDRSRETERSTEFDRCTTVHFGNDYFRTPHESDVVATKNDSVEGYATLIARVTSGDLTTTLVFPISNKTKATVGELGFWNSLDIVHSVTLTKREEGTFAKLTIIDNHSSRSSIELLNSLEEPLSTAFNNYAHAVGITTADKFLEELQRSLRRPERWSVSDNFLLRSALHIQLEIEIVKERSVVNLHTCIQDLLERVDPDLANINLILIAAACNRTKGKISDSFYVDGRSIDKLLGGEKSSSGVKDRLRVISKYLSILSAISSTFLHLERDEFIQTHLWKIEQTGTGLISGRRRPELSARITPGSWLSYLYRNGSLTYIDREMLSLPTNGHALVRDLIEYVTVTNKRRFSIDVFLEYRFIEDELKRWANDRIFRHKTKTNLRKAIVRINKMKGYQAALVENSEDWLDSEITIDRLLVEHRISTNTRPKPHLNVVAHKYSYGDLKQLINRGKYTQTQIAQALGVSKSTVTVWKNRPSSAPLPDEKQESFMKLTMNAIN